MKKLFVFCFLLLVFISFAGCSKDEITILENKIAELEEKLELLETENSTLKAEKESVQNELDSLKTDYESLKAELNLISYDVIIYDIDGEVLGNEKIKSKKEDKLFDQMKIKFDIDYDDGEWGVYLNSINGSICDNNYYIAIYENGTLASTGIEGLILDNNDLFEFKVECWNTIESGYGVLDSYDVLVDKIIYSYAKNYKDSIYCIGSVLGPHPFPLMVRDFQSVVGYEAKDQFVEMTGLMPDVVCACVGGGSNSSGMFIPFLEEPVDIYGVEPLGKGTNLGEHAASMKYGTKGIMHGFESIMLKDENGGPAPVYSIASGLDYPSVGPEHAWLHDLGRVKYDAIGDEEAVDAFFKLARYEGIIPALESAHAVAFAMKKAKEMKYGSILVCLSGRGDKDVDYVVEHYGCGENFRF